MPIPLRLVVCVWDCHPMLSRGISSLHDRRIWVPVLFGVRRRPAYLGPLDRPELNRILHVRSITIA